MRMKFLSIALLLLICHYQNGILYAQSTIQVDTSGVWYTHNQDIRCLICLVNEQKKDSIILEQDNFIKFQDSTIIKLNSLNDSKSIKNKRKTKIIAAGSGVIGFLFGWFVCVLSK